MMHYPPEKPEKPAPYDRDNLRFRKAYIRERLATLNNEKEALNAERDRINALLKDGSKALA